MRRLTSLLLLLFSPALGGTALSAFHPCPVDAPWVAGPHETQPGGHEGHSQPASDSDSHNCTCISSCTSGAALAVPPAAAGVFAAIAPDHETGPPAPDSTLELHPLAELLPPAHAPPLV